MIYSLKKTKIQVEILLNPRKEPFINLIIMPLFISENNTRLLMHNHI